MRKSFPYFLAIAGFALLTFLPYLSAKHVPVDDALYNFRLFHSFYSQTLIHHHWFSWMPYGFYGVPTAMFQVLAIGPIQMLLGAVGLVFHISNVLILFKLAALVQAMLAATGLYLWGGKIFKSRVAMLIPSFMFLATLPWFSDYDFSLKLVYGIPWIMYFFESFFESQRFSYLIAAGIFGLIFAGGIPPYFIPMIVFASMAYFIFRLDLRDWAKATPRFAKMDGLGLAIFLILLVSLLMRIKQATEGLILAPSGRDVETGKSTILTFLSYGGGIGQSIFADWLTGFRWRSYSSYFPGLLTLVLSVQIFRQWERPQARALLASAGALTLMWCGGLFADLMYHVFPGMAYFRHLGHLPALLKMFVCVMAGFGAEALLDSSKIKWKSWYILGAALTFLAIEYSYSYLIRLPEVLAVCVEPILRKCQSAIVSQQAVMAYGRWILIWGSLFWIISKRKYVGTLLLALSLMEAVLFHTANLTVFESSNDPHALALGARTIQWVSSRDKTAEKITGIIPGSDVAYASLYYFLGKDPCIPHGRVDFLSTEVKQVLEARGVPFELNMNGISNDVFLDRILGCNLPKIRWMEHPVITSDRQESLSLIAQGIEGIEGPRDGNSLGQIGPVSNEAVEVESFEPNRIVLKTSGSGWLYLADAFNEGWSAQLDLQSTPVYRANVAFKAVFIPQKAEGETKIVLEYRSFKECILLIVIVCSMLAGLAWTWFLTSNRDRSIRAHV